MKIEYSKGWLIKHNIFPSLNLYFLGVILWKTPRGVHPEYGVYGVLYWIGFSYFLAAITVIKSRKLGQIPEFAYPPLLRLHSAGVLH